MNYVSYVYCRGVCFFSIIFVLGLDNTKIMLILCITKERDIKTKQKGGDRNGEPRNGN